MNKNKEELEEKTKELYSLYRKYYLKRKVNKYEYKNFIRKSTFNIKGGFNFNDVYHIWYNNKTKQISFKNEEVYLKCSIKDFQLKKLEYTVLMNFNGIEYGHRVDDEYSRASRYFFEFLFNWTLYLELLEEEIETPKKNKIKL